MVRYKMNLRRSIALALMVPVLVLQGCQRQTEAEALAKARALLDRQDVAAALVQLKDALDRYPDSTEGRFLLAKVIVQSGDPASALIELQKLERRGFGDARVMPEVARALLAQGEAARVVQRFGDQALADPAAQADLKTSVGYAHAELGRMDLARLAAAEALAHAPASEAASVLMARVLATERDVDGALQLLEQVLTRNPGEAAAGVLKGELLLRQGQQVDAALAAFRQVLAVSPRNLQAQSAVVNALLLAGRGADARSEFGALQKLAPSHADTLTLQAQFAYDDGDYRTARELAQRVLGQRPQHGRALFVAGASEFRLGQYLIAESLLTRAVRLAPNLLPARHLLAHAYLRTAQPGRAVELLMPVTEGESADAGSLTLLGRAHLEAGDGRRAEEAFRRALSRAPDDVGTKAAVVQAQLAQHTAASAPLLAQLDTLAGADKASLADLALIGARVEQGDWAGALKAADALVGKAPDQGQYLVLRGLLQVRAGDGSGAAESFAKVLSQDPQNFAAASGLAELDFAAGRVDASRRRFETLLQHDPRHVRAKVALAGLDARLGVSEAKVVGQLRDAVKLDPTQPLAHLSLVDRLLSVRDTAAALQAAQEAAAALPNDVEILDALGRVHLASGDGVQAVGTFKKLVAMQPSRSLFQSRLADAYLLQKDRASATAALLRAVELDSRNLAAQRGLAVMASQDKRQAEALSRAREIQRQLPANPAGFALEGEVEALAKNWPAAAAAYAEALRREDRVNWAILLHSSLIAAGKSAEAERVYAEWTKRHRADASFTVFLGDQAAKARDWSRAETRYRAALEVQPGHTGALNNLAWVLARQRKPGAVEFAQRALAQAPDRPALLDTLALAFESEDQLAKAIDAQRRATELDPRSPGLRLRLAKLLIKNGDKAKARQELMVLERLGEAFSGQPEVAALLATL